jgi:hypothetical protein
VANDESFFEGAERQENLNRHNARNGGYDPFKVTAGQKARGEGITWVDVWLANPDGAADRDEAAALEVGDVMKHVASEKDLYRGFEKELAEVQRESFEEQGTKLANAPPASFFPDTPPAPPTPAKKSDDDLFPKF